jgi:hypothetical protein
MDRIVLLERKEPKPESPGYVTKTDEYVFPLEKDGRKIDRHVIIHTTRMLKNIFGEDPKKRLEELGRNHSDLQIAEMVSNDQVQVSRNAVGYARFLYRLGENKNESPQGIRKDEYKQIAHYWENRDLIPTLKPREQAALVLSSLLKHAPTLGEMKRLLGFNSEKETSVYLDDLFDRLKIRIRILS